MQLRANANLLRCNTQAVGNKAADVVDQIMIMY